MADSLTCPHGEKVVNGDLTMVKRIFVSMTDKKILLNGVTPSLNVAISICIYLTLSVDPGSSKSTQPSTP